MRPIARPRRNWVRGICPRPPTTLNLIAGLAGPSECEFAYFGTKRQKLVLKCIPGGAVAIERHARIEMVNEVIGVPAEDNVHQGAKRPGKEQNCRIRVAAAFGMGMMNRPVEHHGT